MSPTSYRTAPPRVTKRINRNTRIPIAQTAIRSLDERIVVALAQLEVTRHRCDFPGVPSPAITEPEGKLK